MPESLINELILSKLKLDLIFFWLIVFVVLIIGEGGPLKPEVCFHVAQSYKQLATLCEELGRFAQAQGYQQKAEYFFRASDLGDDDPPPAAALAMPIPEPPIFTSAIGFWIRTQRRGA